MVSLGGLFGGGCLLVGGEKGRKKHCWEYSQRRDMTLKMLKEREPLKEKQGTKWR